MLDLTRMDAHTLKALMVWLIQNGYEVPKGYAPSMGRYHAPDAAGPQNPEELIFSLVSEPESDPRFYEAFFTEHDAQQGTAAERRLVRLTDPTTALKRAGVPMLYVGQYDREAAADVPQLSAWANEYRGQGTPWLWVMGEESDRIAIACAAIVAATHAADRERARRGSTIFTTTRDLCEKVNAAPLYGEGQKSETMQPYTTCALLVLDGMGEESLGRRELETIAHVLSGRYRQTRPTIITSLYGLHHATKRYSCVDQALAATVAKRTAAALSGYQRDADRAAKQELIKAHVVDVRR